MAVELKQPLIQQDKVGFNNATFKDIARITKSRMFAFGWLLSLPFSDWGQVVIALDPTLDQLKLLRKHFSLPDP